MTSAESRTSAMLVIEASCSGVGNTHNDIAKETQMQKHESSFTWAQAKETTHMQVSAEPTKREKPNSWMLLMSVLRTSIGRQTIGCCRCNQLHRKQTTCAQKHEQVSIQHNVRERERSLHGSDTCSLECPLHSHKSKDKQCDTEFFQAVPRSVGQLKHHSSARRQSLRNVFLFSCLNLTQRRGDGRK